MSDLVPQIRGILRVLETRAKKSFGQNFFTDSKKLAKIPVLADVTADDLVLEVGPGLGFLTDELAAAARKVVAVEVDRDLVPYLRDRFAGVPNVEVVEEDILRFDPPDEPYLVVANLPYYLSSRFLRRFLSEVDRRPTRLVVMLQAEVAEKLVSEETNLLGLSVAAYGTAKIVARYKAQDYYPSPKVRSALVRIDVTPEPRIATPEKAFFAVARRAFQGPRKMLGTTMRGTGLAAEPLAAAFASAKVDPTARPSTLSLADFDRLATAVTDALRENG